MFGTKCFGKCKKSEIIFNLKESITLDLNKNPSGEDHALSFQKIQISELCTITAEMIGGGLASGDKINDGSKYAMTSVRDVRAVIMPHEEINMPEYKMGMDKETMLSFQDELDSALEAKREQLKGDHTGVSIEIGNFYYFFAKKPTILTLSCKGLSSLSTRDELERATDNIIEFTH